MTEQEILNAVQDIFRDNFDDDTLEKMCIRDRPYAPMKGGIHRTLAGRACPAPTNQFYIERSFLWIVSP